MYEWVEEWKPYKEWLIPADILNPSIQRTKVVEKVSVTAPALVYPRDAILTREQCAEWLQVSVNTIDRMYLPQVRVGERAVRFIVGRVLDELEVRAE